MLITALCLSHCWPINQEKYVVCSRNRGKQGCGSGSIGDPTTEGVKKWIRPFNFIEGKHCSEADNLPTLYQCCSIGHSKSGIGLSTQIEESNCNEADTFCTLYQFGCIQFPIVPKLRKTMLFAKSPCTLPNLFVLDERSNVTTIVWRIVPIQMFAKSVHIGNLLGSTYTSR